ncbi:DNA repair protein RecN [Limosilactobacillus equigenerosi]|uniref:DNA repair protein RecN n=1 Tax=Limosilactobacillus equigenerosi DSM 18793 = JCM 14505 TaxID=1423742 RepID=A0A0R1UQR5_9LACO|nr:DNA repair protein RecN [Limosilactobacillus equigenerosi]KRL93946.1 DNA repair protein RecN [Limosilactobacillus equigenerosi DSM 18793 = JCM 14505]
MIQELTIDNLAIIDHLSLSFQDQMTVLTGETGAGKSIIIDAVGLLAGGRGSQDFIRRGMDKLSIQGQFTLPDDPACAEFLAAQGIVADESGLVIRREIHKSGRNTIRVNGTLINATLLKQLGHWLVDIQGQNEHQQLLQAETHLGLLDQFAGAELAPIKAKYTSAYQAYLATQTQLKQQQTDAQQWAQRLDMLRYQVDEIGQANLQPEEEEALTQERERLSHFQQINDAFQSLIGVLNENEPTPVLDQVGQVMRDVQAIAEFDPAYQEVSQTLDGAYYALQDVADQASHQLDALEYDPERLVQIDARLTQIGDLERKYGATVADVLSYYDEIQAELTGMEQNAKSDEELTAQLAALAQQLTDLGTQMRTIRQRVAEDLNEKVNTQLHQLYMEKATFAVHFTPLATGQFTSDGLDEVEFYIQTNQGESMGPLVRIASGGELSRVMLALKTIFAAAEGVTSIIFDEVDTGVSGRVAQAIADKIKLIAQHSQVLCITHLPQVAAAAQNHLLIQKRVHDGRTTTTVTPLRLEQRIDEVARMTAGEVITPAARAHAEELLGNRS